MADYQNLSAPELNQINGSSSALGEGTFRRRDELRRAESVQRNRVRMSERLDRNITRAVRKGDARSASAFNALKQSITGQGYMGGGGIVNAEDQQDRVKDGAVKAADTRYNMGNIGNTNPADGPIANAPPPVEKPQGGGPAWDSDNSGIPDSIQRPVAGPQTAPEGATTTLASPSPKLTPGALKSRQAFAADLDRSTLVKTDLAARERAYKRGESIGVSRGEVNRRQGWGGDTGPPKPILDFSVKVEDDQKFQPIDSGRSQFDELTQSAPKNKESPLVATYNQRDRAPILSRESVFGSLDSKSRPTLLTPNESNETQSFGAALADDVNTVARTIDGAIDLVKDQGIYNALNAVSFGRKAIAVAEETGPSMIAKYLPGSVGEWAKKKAKSNFESLGKRSREIDESILRLKNAMTSYNTPSSFPK